MNVDPRDAPDARFELQDVLQQPHRTDRQPNELSAQTSTPASGSEEQARFEQQLDDLDPDELNSIYLTSLPANYTTATSSPAPHERVPETSPYPATSFVSARAQLAATLTGATLAALRNEIDVAAHQSARWSPATAAPVDRDLVFR
ncbi:hypothetical protein [Bradyrhizobium pachyrhizi]|uniref:hypothetical protein n=1 Tax=Bradyrhizobium pachyrhizi TaxID=280333 RepID=UPI001FDAA990|nr:hypothetical protein [Bradyrhizobium pachyrhizi]